jgi:hypothetical protein
MWSDAGIESTNNSEYSNHHAFSSTKQIKLWLSVRNNYTMFEEKCVQIVSHHILFARLADHSTLQSTAEANALTRQHLGERVVAIVDTSRERLEDAVWRETDGMGVQCIIDAQYWMPVATDRALGFAQGESAVVVAAYAASPETSGAAAAAVKSAATVVAPAADTSTAAASAATSGNMNNNVSAANTSGAANVATPAPRGSINASTAGGMSAASFFQSFAAQPAPLSARSAAAAASATASATASTTTCATGTPTTATPAPGTGTGTGTGTGSITPAPVSANKSSSSTTASFFQSLLSAPTSAKGGSGASSASRPSSASNGGPASASASTVSAGDSAPSSRAGSRSNSITSAPPTLAASSGGSVPSSPALSSTSSAMPTAQALSALPSLRSPATGPVVAASSAAAAVPSLATAASAPVLVPAPAPAPPAPSLPLLVPLIIDAAPRFTLRALSDLLAPFGRLLTNHPRLQIDPPTAQRLMLRGATVSFLFEPLWLLAPTQHSVYLRTCPGLVAAFLYQRAGCDQFSDFCH